MTTPEKRAKKREWYQKNREHTLQKQREWRERNPEIVKKSVAKFRTEHADQYREYQREYQRQRLQDPVHKLAHRSRTKIKYDSNTNPKTIKFMEKMSRHLCFNDYADAKSQGYVISFSVPLRWLCEYLIHHEIDEPLRITTDYSNLRLVHGKIARKNACVVDCESLKAAKKLQDKYDLKGLVDFIKSCQNKDPRTKEEQQNDQ